jgi:hypothetical protein
MNTVMNLRVAAELAAFQEGLTSMKLVSCKKIKIF